MICKGGCLRVREVRVRGISPTNMGVLRVSLVQGLCCKQKK